MNQPVENTVMPGSLGQGPETNAIDRVGPDMSEDDAQLLDTFRVWLTAARAESAALSGTCDSADENDARVSKVGLYDLVEAFTALRHEIKLQTKSARSLQDSAQSAVDALQSAMDGFRSVEPREADAARNAARPLAESLAELSEALERCRTVLERVRGGLINEVAAVRVCIDASLTRQPFWKRWLCRSFATSLQDELEQRARSTQQPLLDSLFEGYVLIQQRLERAMQEHRVERIACLGRSADVTCMTVIEMLESPDATPGAVVEEVRPGYRWNGDVLRFAEVRVATAGSTAGPVDRQFPDVETPDSESQNKS